MIEDEINAYLLEKNEKEREQHVKSGFLSASRLGRPTLENVLYLIGVPPVELTLYSLKVFERGNSVEDWLISVLRNRGILDREQTEVVYTTPKGHKVVGIEDVRLKGESMPTEVKSIKNSAFKYLDTEGAKIAHVLQASTYALGQGESKSRILYVAADDYRTKQFVIDATQYKQQIDELADKTYTALENGVLPEFEPIDEFHRLGVYKGYTGYPDWLGRYEVRSIQKSFNKDGKLVKYSRKEEVLVEPFTSKQLEDKLLREHPEAYKLLKKGLK